MPNCRAALTGSTPSRIAPKTAVFGSIAGSRAAVLLPLLVDAADAEPGPAAIAACGPQVRVMPASFVHVTDGVADVSCMARSVSAMTITGAVAAINHRARRTVAPMG